jgi:hypothetical protein
VLCITAKWAAYVGDGSNCDEAESTSMSAYTSSGHVTALALVRVVPGPEVSTCRNINLNGAGKVHAFGVDRFPPVKDGRNPQQGRDASRVVP